MHEGSPASPPLIYHLHRDIPRLFHHLHRNDCRAKSLELTLQRLDRARILRARQEAIPADRNHVEDRRTGVDGHPSQVDDLDGAEDAPLLLNTASRRKRSESAMRERESQSCDVRAPQPIGETLANALNVRRAPPRSLLHRTLANIKEGGSEGREDGGVGDGASADGCGSKAGLASCSSGLRKGAGPVEKDQWTWMLICHSTLPPHRDREVQQEYDNSCFRLLHRFPIPGWPSTVAGEGRERLTGPTTPDVDPIEQGMPAIGKRGEAAGAVEHEPSCTVPLRWPSAHVPDRRSQRKGAPHARASSAFRMRVAAASNQAQR